MEWLQSVIGFVSNILSACLGGNKQTKQTAQSESGSATNYIIQGDHNVIGINDNTSQDEETPTANIECAEKSVEDIYDMTLGGNAAQQIAAANLEGKRLRGVKGWLCGDQVYDEDRDLCSVDIKTIQDDFDHTTDKWVSNENAHIVRLEFPVLSHEGPDMIEEALCYDGNLKRWHQTILIEVEGIISDLPSISSDSKGRVALTGAPLGPAVHNPLVLKDVSIRNTKVVPAREILARMRIPDQQESLRMHSLGATYDSTTGDWYAK